MVLAGDGRVDAAMRAACDEAGVPIEVREDRHFYATPEQFAAWANGRRELRLEWFYRDLRKRHRVLMDGAKPATGQWNYDHDNRSGFGPQGPGFLPAVISVLLMLFGTGLFFRAVRLDGPGLGALHLRPFVSLPIALLLFSLLISRAGLPITIAVTIAWLTLTGGDRRWVESAFLAVGMIAFCVGVFAFALGQPVPLWIR